MWLLLTTLGILSKLSIDQSKIYTCKTGLTSLFFNILLNLFTVPDAINYSKHVYFQYKIMKCQKIYISPDDYLSKINYLCMQHHQKTKYSYWLSISKLRK